MKLITIVPVSSLLLTLSAHTLASDPIAHLSATSIKQTLTSEQIQQSLHHWYMDELSQVEEQAQNISDRIPINIRRVFVTQTIDSEYEALKTEFGL